jgi:hypothetical protein
VVGKLEPKVGENNGIYCIEGEFPVVAPAGVQFPYRRTLWIGTKADPFAKLPETRLKSPGLRFLKAIAEANKLPSNDQSDQALCAAITGRTFGCRIIKTSYVKDGVTKNGTDFGRKVTPAGVIPAKWDDEPMSNGLAGTPVPAAAGASFATE